MKQRIDLQSTAAKQSAAMMRLEQTIELDRKLRRRPVGRQAVARPLAQGDGERLLHRVLGDVDVTEDADQSRYGSAGLLPKDPARLRLVELGCGVDVAQSVRPQLPGTDGPRSGA